MASAKRSAPSESARQREAPIIDLTAEEGSGPPNAFALMMSKAKEVAPKEDFVCCFLSGAGGPESGHWDWSWGAAGKIELGGLGPCRSRITLKQCPGSKPTELRLYTNVPSFNPAGLAIGPPPIRSLEADASCRLSPSMLKSLLQKAVRRGLVDSALPLAAELWARGPVDALRRLLIIIIEDTLLHPAYPALTFFMMAGSEEYVLGTLQAALFLSVVRDICKCATKDTVSEAWSLAAITGSEGSSAWEGQPANGELVLTPGHLAHLGTGPSALLRSLQARALYGGMGGDIAMLRSSAAVWACRFAWDQFERQRAGSPAATSSSSSSSSSPSSGTPAWLQQHSPPAPSKTWLHLICSAHGARLAHSSFHGPFALQLLLTPRVTVALCPLSGVDHHVSDIVDNVLSAGGAFEGISSKGGKVVEAVSRALEILEGQDGVARADVASALSSLMWSLRSSTNPRRGLGGAALQVDNNPSLAARSAFALLEPFFDEYSRALLEARLG